MEEAIESAASYITQKEVKHHKKHKGSCDKKHSTGSSDDSAESGSGYTKLEMDEHCHCKEAITQVEQGKRSRVMKSSIIDRNVQRRKGVAAQNDMEKKLVKETVEVLVKTENMKEYNLI